jgi:methyl-accepting chemotaxis protein
MLSNNIDFTEIQIHPEYNIYAFGLIKEIASSNNEIEEIVFSTTDKKVIRYPERQTEAGYDPTARPWYKEGMENNGKAVVTKPYKSVDGNLVVSISKTVSYNNQIVGVISISVNLNNLSESISQYKVGNNGFVVVFDGNGLGISHPDKANIGTDVFTKRSYWNEVKSNEQGFTEYTLEGIDKFGSYTTNKNTGWKIMANVPKSELNEETNNVRKLLLIFLIIALPINILVATVFSRMINNSIVKLNKVFGKASDGDLTEIVNLNTRDEFEELGNSFNKMTEGIRNLISKVKNSSNTISNTGISIADMSNETTGAIEEITKNMDQVAMGSTDQAKEIESAASDLQSLAEKLQHINEETNNMQKVSESTDGMTREGLVVMDTLSNKSADTRDVSDKIEVAVKDMSTASNNIKTIINSINQIAEQTNLLALNAAIEAARAGEAGRGFSIVADEIRKLAEQSTLATKDIENLILEVESKSHLAVKAVSESKSTITEQEEALNKTKVTFTHIADSIINLTKIIDNVQNSILDINKDKDVIMGKMQNLSAISEETAASTQEVSAAAEEVFATMDDFNENAKGLKKLVEDLENDINKFTI